MKNREVFTWVSKSNKFCHRFPKLKIRGVCDCERMSVYGELCGKITDRKKKNCVNNYLKERMEE